MIRKTRIDILGEPPKFSKKQKTAALCALLSFTTLASSKELEKQVYADEKIVPSPACLCAAPDGTVYVGVDMLGSLGKGPGKGKIVRLIDSDNDKKADKHSVANISIKSSINHNSVSKTRD